MPWRNDKAGDGFATCSSSLWYSGSSSSFGGSGSILFHHFSISLFSLNTMSEHTPTCFSFDYQVAVVAKTADVNHVVTRFLPCIGFAQIPNASTKDLG